MVGNRKSSETIGGLEVRRQELEVALVGRLDADLLVVRGSVHAAAGLRANRSASKQSPHDGRLLKGCE